MNWTKLIGHEIETTYKAAEGLMDLVDEDQLGWKPSTGSNWMTTGQLLRHMTSACGSSCRGFVTGDWGMPDGVDAAGIDAAAGRKATHRSERRQDFLLTAETLGEFRCGEDPGVGP